MKSLRTQISNAFLITTLVLFSANTQAASGAEQAPSWPSAQVETSGVANPIGRQGGATDKPDEQTLAACRSAAFQASANGDTVMRRAMSRASQAAAQAVHSTLSGRQIATGPENARRILEDAINTIAGYRDGCMGTCSSVGADDPARQRCDQGLNQMVQALAARQNGI